MCHLQKIQSDGGVIFSDLSFISDIRSDMTSLCVLSCKPCFRGAHA